MLLYSLAVVLGLILLVWSADRFVDGASMVAKHYGVSPLLIGMIIIGFGTSAPEMVVSAISSYQGNPGIALGNAYGSNITNIALILGITSVLKPISVHSQIIRKELPILLGITLVSIALIYDLSISRMDALIMLLVFGALMFWTIRTGLTSNKDALEEEFEAELKGQEISIQRAFFSLVFGFVILLVSSRGLVWGAVGLASMFGVSDIIIGLTVVAVGTSLPELASSVAAARKGESDIAIGNVLGSNFFNTLAVVGISGSIQPLSFSKEILYRDVSVMSGLTLSLFVFCYGWKGEGKITRLEGAILLCCYIGYTTYLVSTTLK